MEQTTINIQQERNLIAEISQRYLPYWPLFLITLALSLSTAFLYLRYTPPLYLSNGKVLLKDDKSGASASKVLDELNIYDKEISVENEIDILRSLPIMESVVKDLHLYTQVYMNGQVRDDELYGKGSPIQLISLRPDSIEAIADLIRFTVDPAKRSISLKEKTYYDGDVLPIGTNLFKLVLNAPYAANADKGTYLLQVNSTRNTARAILNTLAIVPSSKQSTVLQLKIESAVPEKGEAIINTLFEEYKKAGLEDKNQVAGNTLAFVEDRLRSVIGELDSVERSIEAYKAKEGIVDIGQQAQLYLATVQQNDVQASQIDIQLAVLKEVEKYVNGKRGKPGTVPSLLGINDATLAQLLNKLYEADVQYARLQQINGEQNDVLIHLNEQIQDNKLSILENMANIRRSLNITKNQLSGNSARENNLLSQIPQKERELMNISRQQAIKSNIYTFLLQKREETAISYVSAVSDSRLVEAGWSNAIPVKPVPNMIYLVALVFGILSSVLIVMVREQFNRTIMFRKEVEQQTGVPVIGELMQGEDHRSPLVINEGKRTLIAEQIRIIRTNLAYFGINEQSKTILVSSSISGEGKSFAAMNVAVSYTLMNKKVALVELDLRKPKIAKQLRITSNVGISNYLAGRLV